MPTKKQNWNLLFIDINSCQNIETNSMSKEKLTENGLDRFGKYNNDYNRLKKDTSLK